ncbi:unnamed protein product [Cuscuta campestris]|uniref:Uncharacterized protein n=1 Tax=Cuscuta campestris TaxID=132261 RepID=A0A484N3K8_9ASTE|nr:unnamed protein product [Cuscuta campestris]
MQEKDKDINSSFLFTPLGKYPVQILEDYNNHNSSTIKTWGVHPSSKSQIISLFSPQLRSLCNTLRPANSVRCCPTGRRGYRDGI